MGAITIFGCFLRHIYEPCLKPKCERLFCIDGELICFRGFVVPRFLRNLFDTTQSHDSSATRITGTVYTLDNMEETQTIKRRYPGLDIRRGDIGAADEED